ncbi:MAG TPA: glycine oxidase ThiO, partial [Candidatus Binataceae bacterium]|nr:glycine oxidase ThiO [Candidatus Binataceae bacterium]
LEEEICRYSTMATGAKKIVIIGGGIIGCSVAWRLAREGNAVTVLERGRLGREASWAAAGMIAPQAEAQAAGPFFDLCVRAREVFEPTLEMLRADTEVDPEYDRKGILYLALNDSERAELVERAQWQSAAGGAVEELSPEAARKLEPAISPETVYALHMPLDRRVENRKLTQAYAAAAAARGAQFVEGVTVLEAVTRSGRVTAVRSHDGRLFESDVVVNAAGSWAGAIRGIDDRVETHPVRGQMVCFEARPETLGVSIFSLRGYLVPRRDGRILAGSTMEEAGFDKSVTLAGLAKIARGAIEMVPALGDLPFREAWAGLRPATRDFLPVLGASPSAPNFFYATGHFRSGILLSAITGEILADLIQGRKPALEIAPFSPSRFAASAQIKALGLVRDILFRSRIDAAAQTLGVEVAYASEWERARGRCAELKPKLVFVDLSDANFTLDKIYGEIRSATAGTRLIGFASHVDLKALKSARDAGFDMTLSRSEFTARIAELLSS